MKTCKCETCGKENSGNYGSGRFCSSKCARSFSTKNKRKEINQKVSDSMVGRGHENLIINCKNCGHEFEVTWNKRHRLYCSHKCSGLASWRNEDYRMKMSEINSRSAKHRHYKGDKSFGWKSRKKLQPSYPETIAMNVLNSLNIQFEYEMPLGKYYIDFAIPDRKIAIEIDGLQHNKPERKKTDKIKDDLLIQSGWKVFRIKWPSDNIVESIKYILK